ALALRPCRFSCIGESALRPLTVKLRGRTTTSDKRRGRTLSPGARGAKQTTPHGPLQRLLGATRCTFLSQRFQEVGRGTIVPLLKPVASLQISLPHSDRCTAQRPESREMRPSTRRCGRPW